MRGALITGWGAALPEKIITNDDLAQSLDTSDEWITERTGIKERRIGGTTAGLAIEAGAKAMAQAGVDPSEIDLLILATTTGDDQVPATSGVVAHGLGLRAGAFDLNAACSGWVYGLVAAHGFVAAGAAKVLVIGAETLSRITDWSDRRTAILFADGAGAVVVEATDGPGELLGWELTVDGSLRHILYADVGGYLQMEGREVFRQAVRVMVSSAQAALAKAGVEAREVAAVIPHQANVRIIDSAMDKLGIPRERAVVNLPRTGNTSAASIPMALAEALDEGRIAGGDIVLFVGFGAGMTAAAAVVRWGGS
jgi:3-oxoacyl-[acyl-carrier-protein] synthase-3